MIGKMIADVSGESQLGWLRLRDLFQGAWGIVFTFPTDMHPVWATELGALTKLKKEFESRNCRVVCLNISTADRQEKLIDHVNETQDVTLSVPIITDTTGDISKKLGIMPPDFSTEDKIFRYSSVLITDIDLEIRFVMQYPTCVGRNIYELIRALDAIQLANFNQVVTPTNWKINDDVFIEPDVTSEAAKALFPQGFHEIKPYFRITPSPAITDED